jgi:probable F420-dependent oxidoreductase
MFEKRLSLSVPLDGFSLPEHAEIARAAERLGYRDSWSYEVDGNDAFLPLSVIAQSTGMRLGTAIVNVYTRGPATIAMSAAAMADLAPGRFILGLGSGSQPIVEMWNGGKFERPATRVREMVQFVRQALTGERVVFEGKTFSVNGFRLTRPPAQQPPIHVAALREGMLRVAGEVADGCCINWLSAEDVKKSVKVIRDAAAAAGRDPTAIEITARLMVNIDPRSPESDTAARRAITAYLNVPVYRHFHEWLGRTPVLTPMWEAWGSGDRKAAVAAIPDQVVEDLMIRGTAEERNAHVQRYLDAGIDTAFLSWQTLEQDPVAKRELILKAMREMAPA